MKIDTRTLRRSALMAPLIAGTGMGLQTIGSRFILHGGPPSLQHLIGVAACYLGAGFGFALGFFLAIERWPGRSTMAKGLSYAAIVLLAVWLSGFFNICALDFSGGWDWLSPAKLKNYFMGAIDSLNLCLWGLAAGWLARKDPLPPRPSRPRAAWLPAGIAIGALALPALCAGFFILSSALLPHGFELGGERSGVFFFYLFVPLSLAGAGTALARHFLGSGGLRGATASAARAFAFLFILWWVPNIAFILFFGFTWQSLVDVYAAIAAALFLTLMAMEAAARRSLAAESRPISLES